MRKKGNYCQWINFFPPLSSFWQILWCNYRMLCSVKSLGSLASCRFFQLKFEVGKELAFETVNLKKTVAPFVLSKPHTIELIIHTEKHLKLPPGLPVAWWLGLLPRMWENGRTEMWNRTSHIPFECLIYSALYSSERISDFDHKTFLELRSLALKQACSHEKFQLINGHFLIEKPFY